MNHPADWLRAAIAYHEAGHAVVRCVLGFGPKSAKIMPKQDADGAAHYANPLRGIKLDTDGSSGEQDLFRSRLDQIIDMKHALVKLSRAIDWRGLEERFGSVYTDGPGRVKPYSSGQR